MAGDLEMGSDGGDGKRPVSPDRTHGRPFGFHCGPRMFPRRADPRGWAPTPAIPGPTEYALNRAREGLEEHSWRRTQVLGTKFIWCCEEGTAVAKEKIGAIVI